MLEDEHFYCSRNEFIEWAANKKNLGWNTFIA